MKTKILTRYAIMLIIAGGVGFVACKKSAMSSSSDSTSTSSVQTAADDQSQVSYESDAVTDDANAALSAQASVSGTSIASMPGSARISTFGIKQVDSVSGHIDTTVVLKELICDATVSITDSNGIRSITITYNGNNCNGTRTRTGTVSLSIPNGQLWATPGAAVTLTIDNLKITRIRDGKTIIINGTKTYTNVSGGLLVDLPNLDSVVHTITGNMSITFGDGDVRDWNVSKRRVFTYNNGVVLTTTGTHADTAGNSDVAEWGTNRYGVTFESLITVPKVIAQSCEFRLTSGQNEILRSDNITSTITYGLNADGQATGCPTTGTYYFELVVHRPNGNQYTYILPY